MRFIITPRGFVVEMAKDLDSCEVEIREDLSCWRVKKTYNEKNFDVFVGKDACLQGDHFNDVSITIAEWKILRNALAEKFPFNKGDKENADTEDTLGEQEEDNES